MVRNQTAGDRPQVTLSFPEQIRRGVFVVYFHSNVNTDRVCFKDGKDMLLVLSVSPSHPY